jgi:hypothetical protein
VSSRIDWFRSTYGESVLQKVLAKLPAEQQIILSRKAPLVGWYPMSNFEQLLEAMYQEANRQSPLTRDAFDHQHLAASTTVTQKLYNFISSLIPPEFLMLQLASVFNRVHLGVELSMLKNKKGYARFLSTGSIDMYPLADRTSRIGLIYYLREAGAKNISIKRLREEKGSERFLLETEVSYE